MDVAPGFSENVCTFAATKEERWNTGIVNWDIGRNMEHVDAYIFWFPHRKNE
jgi:hypothetical protein